MDLGIAEFQKLHNDLNALYKDGKHEELLKHYTDDCYFLTPFQAPYGIKEAPEAFKNTKMQGYDKSELTITVDDVKVNGGLAIDRGHYLLKHEGEKKGRKQSCGTSRKLGFCISLKYGPKKGLPTHDSSCGPDN
uniref:DUF4440 domain-containing protein n=1 Tax=Ascaris lumbricoides TaxID=6252 RepID=A0A0M3HZC6_ASCLU